MSAKHNLVCEQATTFTFQFTIKTGNTPWDLTNYNATMTIRPFVGSAVTTLLANETNGRIVLGTTNGQVTVTLSSTLTTAITAGRYVYDFILESGSVTTRLLEGKFVVTPAVTI